MAMGNLYFPALGMIFFGKPVHLLYLVHAGSWGRTSTAIGITASFLGTAYLVCVGYSVFLYWIFLSESVTADYITDSVVLIFIGSLLSSFFLGCVTILWPFYKRPGTWTSPPDQNSPVQLQADVAQCKLVLCTPSC